MHEVASGHVEAHTTGHGSHLLVDDRLDDLQTSLEAGGEVLLLTDEEEDRPRHLAGRSVSRTRPITGH